MRAHVTTGGRRVLQHVAATPPPRREDIGDRGPDRRVRETNAGLALVDPGLRTLTGDLARQLEAMQLPEQNRSAEPDHGEAQSTKRIAREPSARSDRRTDSAGIGREVRPVVNPIVLGTYGCVHE